MNSIKKWPKLKRIKILDENDIISHEEELIKEITRILLEFAHQTLDLYYLEYKY